MARSRAAIGSFNSSIRMLSMILSGPRASGCSATPSLRHCSVSTSRAVQKSRTNWLRFSKPRGISHAPRSFTFWRHRMRRFCSPIGKPPSSPGAASSC